MESCSNVIFLVVVLMEDQKRPAGLDIIHLPEGPHLHYSLTNWVDGKRLPGHGKVSAPFYQGEFRIHFPSLPKEPLLMIYCLRAWISIQR